MVQYVIYLKVTLPNYIKYIVLQEILGGATILNLHEHMLLDTRFSFLKEMLKVNKHGWRW